MANKLPTLTELLLESIRETEMLSELSAPPYRVFNVRIGDGSNVANYATIHGTGTAWHFKNANNRKQEFISACSDRVKNILPEKSQSDRPSASSRTFRPEHRYAILLVIEQYMDKVIDVEQIGDTYPDLESATAAKEAVLAGATNAADRIAARPAPNRGSRKDRQQNAS